MKVKLISSIDRPYELAVAAARTCYNSKIFFPEDISGTEKKNNLRDKIAHDTLHAGHLTTRQHAHFVFALEGISRYSIHNFLHAHPFYNSEQVSQRYVAISSGNYFYPEFLSSDAKIIYSDTIKIMEEAYLYLNDLLYPTVSSEYFKIFKARANYPEKWKSVISKKVMEVSRYIIPIAALSNLYHSISGLTLLRYYKMRESFALPLEIKNLIEKMFEQLTLHHPLFTQDVEDSLALSDTPEYKFLLKNFNKVDLDFSRAEKFCKEFDSEFINQSSGLSYQYSLLKDYSVQGIDTLCDSLRSSLAIPKDELSNKDCISFLLHPSENKNLLDNLNLQSLSIASRSLAMMHYTFKKRISHSADSQNQRHRMVPGARPALFTQYSSKADYITPVFIKKNKEANLFYKKQMQKIFININSIIEIQKKDTTLNQKTIHENIHSVLYLLPNAFPVRFFETGDLASLHHKWKTRICYNAQEEIFSSSMEELLQVEKIHPEISARIAPPCILRKEAEMKPYCPEASRYCGVKVWNLKLKEFSRVL